MVKLLIAGDVQDYSVFLAKIKSVNGSKHGPFDVALCTRLSGAAWQSLSSAEAAPIPVFALADVLDGPLALQYLTGTPASASSNVTFLGAQGVTDVAGLSIAFSNAGDASELEAQLRERQSRGAVLDVLLTTRWPADVVSDAPASSFPAGVSRAGSGGAASLARLAVAGAPRYHFAAGGDVFFQRAPYTNAEPGETGCATRFISLAAAPSASASAEGKGERKWLHALALPPAAGMSKEALQEVPPGVTPNPYLAASRKRCAPAPAAGDDAGPDSKRARTGGAGEGTGAGRSFVPAGFNAQRAAQLADESERSGQGGAMFWGSRGGAGGMRGGRGGSMQAHRGGYGQGAGAQGMPGPPPECWFCLASPSVEKHLVVSVGTEAYLAMPKGGLAHTHLLIVPVKHVASLATAPAALQEEMLAFLSCLSTWFTSQGLSLLAFERVLHRERTPGAAPALPTHTHMQVIGLPHAAAAAAAATFRTEGAFRLPAITFTELPSSVSLADHVIPQGTGTGHDTCEYLYVEAGAHGAGEGASPPRVRLLHRVPVGTRHPVQFGRETLCRLLCCPEKIQWKACTVSKEEEAAAAQRVRAEFAPHDFTLAL